MKNRFKVFLLCFTFYNLIVFAQQVSGSTSQTAQDEQATVYIYRLDNGEVISSLFVKTSPIYFGSGESNKTKLHKIAGLRNRHYLMMRLPVGKYAFDTRLMDGRTYLEVKARGEYYLHLDRGNNCGTEDPDDIHYPSRRCQPRSASIKEVEILQGQNDLKKLTPIKEKDIKDKRQVIVPPVI